MLLFLLVFNGTRCLSPQRLHLHVAYTLSMHCHKRYSWVNEIPYFNLETIYIKNMITSVNLLNYDIIYRVFIYNLKSCVGPISTKHITIKSCLYRRWLQYWVLFLTEMSNFLHSLTNLRKVLSLRWFENTGPGQNYFESQYISIDISD